MRPTPTAVTGAARSPSPQTSNGQDLAAGDGAAAIQAEAERDRAVKALVDYLSAKTPLKSKSRNLATVAQPRRFGTALRQEFALLSDDDPKSLRGLARRLITEAAEAANPLAAIKEIANRLDIDDAEDGAPEQIDRIERIIVYPENSDR